MSLNNNIVGMFAVILIILNLIGQYTLVQKASDLQAQPEFIGKAVGTVSLMITGTPQGVGFNAMLGSDNRSIILTWNDQGHDNVSIFITDDYSAGFDLVPNITNVTIMNWTDTTAGDVPQRFYRIRVFQGGASYFANNTVGKYDIPIRYADGTPATYELNQVSLPLIPTNNSFEDIVRWSSPGDIVLRFNTSDLGATFQGWETNIRLAGVWIKNFDSLSNLEGYVFINVLNPYNLTIVGDVPTGPVTIPMYPVSGSPTGYEMMLLGWNSLDTNCNLAAALNTAEADTVLWFNTTDQGAMYAGWETYLQIMGTWFPNNGCMYPGVGYRFLSINNPYNWTYNRG